MERWQRRVLVGLGTVVVIMAALAVVLVIRNALGSSGLTGQPGASEVASSTTGATDPATETSPVTSGNNQEEPAGPTTTTVAGVTIPTLPPPPATFVEETISASDLRLQPEGLGPIPFGTDVNRTLNTLTAALGAPDADSGWLPATVDQLQCPGTRARQVTWGSLDVFFSDGPTDWGADGFEHFFSFSYSLNPGSSSPAGPSLRTSEGLQLGATLSRSSSIYGESSITRDHPTEGTILEVEVPGPGYMMGVFAETDDDLLLVSLGGGTGCRG